MHPIVEELIEKKLNIEPYLLSDYGVKMTREIVIDDYYAIYGKNRRGEISLGLYRCKANVDIPSLYPKGMECIFLVDYQGDTMPYLPDTVKVIYMERCNITKFIHKFPKNVQEICIIKLRNLQKLPDMTYLKKLWCLDITVCDLKRLPKLPECLKFLSITGNLEFSTSFKSLPSNLVYFNIGNAYKVIKVPDLTYLKKLKYLGIFRNFIPGYLKYLGIFSKFRSKHNPIKIHKKTKEMNIEIDLTDRMK